MVCFIVPLVAAVATSIVWGVGKRGAAGWWLNLLLYGGVFFGVIDHLWFGEFLLGFEQLLAGTAPLTDLMLGFTITGSIFAFWGIIMGLAKLNPHLAKTMGLTLTRTAPTEN